MSSFKIASQFRKAAEVANDIPIEKFPLLLNRVIQKLHVKGAQLFSEEEEAQLIKLFSLSEENLRLVLNACCYIYEQAAFTSTGPEPLYAILLDAGFDEAHGKIVGKLWKEQAPGFIAKLKERNLGSATLVNVDHHLNLTLGGSKLQRLQDPTAIFELSITNPEANLSQSQGPGGALDGKDKDSSIEKVSLEFDHQELYSLFSDLEKIQSQLDALS